MYYGNTFYERSAQKCSVGILVSAHNPEFSFRKHNQASIAYFKTNKTTDK